jgi:hypothetical protein
MAQSLRLISISSSRSVRVLHAALRRRKLEVRVLAGAPFHQAAGCCLRFLRGRGEQCTPLVKETMPGQRRPEDPLSTSGMARPKTPATTSTSTAASEEDSNPRRSDRRTRGAEAPSRQTAERHLCAAGAANTRGSTGMPDQFPK